MSTADDAWQELKAEHPEAEQQTQTTRPTGRRYPTRTDVQSDLWDDHPEPTRK